MLYDDLEKTQVSRDASPEVVRGALASLYRTPEAVQDIVTSLSKEPAITFSEEDLLYVPFETKDDQLFLTVSINDYCIPNVLVDTGASFHLCLLVTIKALGIPDDALSPSRMLVHAYDDSTRNARGKITLDMTVGPAVFPTKFHVVDIKPPYRNIEI